MALTDADLPKLVELLNRIDIRVQVRRRLAADWVSLNEVLLVGEFGLELDTGLYKRGDGATAWNDLLYLLLPPYFAVAGGTANALTAAFVFTPVLIDGITQLNVRAAAANTGAVTLNPNGAGALAVKMSGGVALSGGEIPRAGFELLLRYVDGSPGHLELLNPYVAPPTGGSSAWTNCGHWSFATDGAVSQFFSSAIGAYSEALIVFDQVSMVSGGWRQIQASIDGGSTYMSTSGNYRSIDTNGAITNESGILAHSTSNATVRSANVGIHLMNCAVYKPVDTPARTSALAQIVTTSTITNLRVYTSNGSNFNGGTIQIWCR